MHNMTNSSDLDRVFKDENSLNEQRETLQRFAAHTLHALPMGCAEIDNRLYLFEVRLLAFKLLNGRERGSLQKWEYVLRQIEDWEYIRGDVEKRRQSM